VILLSNKTDAVAIILTRSDFRPRSQHRVTIRTERSPSGAIGLVEWRPGGFWKIRIHFRIDGRAFRPSGVCWPRRVGFARYCGRLFQRRMAGWRNILRGQAGRLLRLGTICNDFKHGSRSVSLLGGRIGVGLSLCIFPKSILQS